MYSNDQTEIRAGLVNYIGAIISSSPYQNEQAIKHNVVALLLEEAMKICKDKDGLYDMYAAKPILRLTADISKQRKNLIESMDALNPEMIALKDKYTTITNHLNDIINNTKI